MKKLIILLAVLIISVDFALGIGAIPAKTEFYGNKEHSGTFTVIPSSSMPTRITISVEGELKDNISVSPIEQIVIGSKEFSFNLTGSFEPGSHKAKIIISEEAYGVGTVTSKPSVHHTVNLFVPYPKQFLETRLLVINDNQYLIKFTTVMDNKGSEQLDDIENELNIYDNKEKIAALYKAELINGDYDVVLGYGIAGTTEKKTLSLPRKTFSIEPGRSYENQIKAKKFLFEPGLYDVESVISYAGKINKETSEFKIGQEEITIYLETKTANVERINKFVILLSSNWNKEIEDVNLSADVIKDGVLIASLEHEIIDVKPDRNESTALYWKAYELELGEYTLKAKTQFKDRTSEEEFTIELAEEVRRVPPLLYVSVFLALIAIALIIVWKKLKEKPKETAKKKKGKKKGKKK